MNLNKKYLGIPLKWYILVFAIFMIINYPGRYLFSVMPYDACDSDDYYIQDGNLYQKSTIAGMKFSPSGWSFAEYEWKNCQDYGYEGAPQKACELYKNGIHICSNYIHTGFHLNGCYNGQRYVYCPEANNLVIYPESDTYSYVGVYYMHPGQLQERFPCSPELTYSIEGRPAILISEKEETYNLGEPGQFTITVYTGGKI